MPLEHLSTPPSPSYVKLFSRIQRLVTTPRALLEKQVDIAPRHGEAPEDWQRLIDDIRQFDTVSLTRRPDGSVHLRWRPSIL